MFIIFYNFFSENVNSFSNVTFQQMEEKSAMPKGWLAFRDTGSSWRKTYTRRAATVPATRPVKTRTTSLKARKQSRCKTYTFECSWQQCHKVKLRSIQISNRCSLPHSRPAVQLTFHIPYMHDFSDFLVILFHSLVIFYSFCSLFSLCVSIYFLRCVALLLNIPSFFLRFFISFCSSFSL